MDSGTPKISTLGEEKRRQIRNKHFVVFEKLVFMGWLHEERDVNFLIRAAAYFPQHVFIFAGGNHDQIISLQDLSKRLNLKNVLLVSYPNLKQLSYARCRCLCTQGRPKRKQ